MMSLLQFTISSDNFTPAKYQSLGQLFTTIITILLAVGAVTSIFFIILGGVKMITGAGDPKKIESARGTIMYALIGLVVNALAFVILQVVQYILRSNIRI
jgi:hypothetical protein